MSTAESEPYFTIGHSTRPLPAFVGLLQASAVTVLVDVRRVPRSRTNPQFNEDHLRDALPQQQLAYVRLAALGGWRGRAPAAAASPNGGWRVKSFRNYADYALTEPFREELAALREIGATRRCAIMCAEAVWWRCHRRIIADYLLAGGEQVFHILGPRHVDPARLTPGALVQPDGAVLYPAATA